MRQISLAKISVAAGTTAITASMITDERLNPGVCGIVTEQVKVDTSVMQSQFDSLLRSIKDELDALESGVAVELKKLLFTNVTVPVSRFVVDSTYQDYGFRAAIPLTGVISSMIPEVVLGVEDAGSGDFAPVAESYDGGVYLYAASKPQNNITIPTIICWRG